MEKNKYYIDREWLTLQEAGKILEKQPSSLRGAIQRGKYDRVKKKRNKNGEYWLIHRDEIMNEIANKDHTIVRSNTLKNAAELKLPIDVKRYVIDKDSLHREENRDRVLKMDDRMIAVPVDYYEQQQKERDQLFQGLVMYRYKFEEADRLMKMLPDSVENVIEELKRKTEDLEKAKRSIQEANEMKEKYKSALIQLEKKIKEEEKEISELKSQFERAGIITKLPWWKKIFYK